MTGEGKTADHDRSWPHVLLRLVGEIIVIVLGVFIALAADSWREGRADRAREAAYVRALDVDMETAAHAVNEAIRKDSTSAGKTLAMVRLLRSTVAPPDDSWRQLAFEVASVSLRTGTVDALISTGDIGLLRSQELRSALLQLSASLQADLGWIRMLDVETARNVERVTLEIESIEIRDGDGETGSPMSGLSLTSLRHSAAMRAGFIAHLTILQNRLEALRDIRDGVEKVQARLSEQKTDDHL